jgi:GWxTD domain-containing protein
MRALVALLLLAAALARVGPASAAQVDAGTPPSLGDIRFATEVVVTPAMAGQGRVEIRYAVSNDDLVFLRTADGYASRYEITAVLWDGGGRQVSGDSWRRRVRASSYAETNSRAAAVRDTLVLGAPPGSYLLRLELQSLDTDARGLVERQVVVTAYAPGSLVLGTVSFERGGPAAAGGSFEPNPSRDYGEEWPNLRAHVPVYADSGSLLRLDFAVETDKGAVEESRSDTVRQTAAITEHALDLSVLGLDVGIHYLRIRVKPAAGGQAVDVKAQFRVLTSPRSWGEDFEKMIAQIGYVASREEVERLTSAPEAERDAAWAEFWKGRDPDPATEENEFRAEFLRRLGYANMHFRSTVDGWQTDMGRVYIQYGDPDDVESEPIDKMLHSWEVWYYYRDHKKFSFVDTEGFGEFTLVETSRI